MDGHYITEQKQILKEQRRFYETLYTTNPDIIFDCKENESRLVDWQCAMLEAEIDAVELYENICKLKPNKVPGCDGLPKEFYQKFFYVLKPHLIRLYSHVLKNGTLNLSARKGLITLLPKKKSNVLLLKSWRPLTMLN